MGEERRTNDRIACPGTAKVRDMNTDVKLDGRISDVGPGGCYIEMMTPFEPGTKVEVFLDARGVQLVAVGEVASMHPTMGMGIHFTQVAASEQPKLEALLAKAAAG